MRSAARWIAPISLSAILIAPRAGSARLLALGPVAPAAVGSTRDLGRIGRFADVRLTGETARPESVAILLSGDGGADRTVADLAAALGDLRALVVEVETTPYLRALDGSSETCVYPAADLEELSKTVQRRLGLPRYRPPVLVGFSSGATLAYAALAEAPPSTFRGAISFGFCPGLPVARPLCKGRGLTFAREGDKLIFEPTTSLAEPWVAFHGGEDQVCAPERTAAFVRATAGAALALLPRAGHGFTEVAEWRPRLAAEWRRLTAEPPAVPRPADVADLPLVEVPAAATAGGERRFAVVLSGDGGWAGLDREVAGELAGRGIPAVGWNSLSYFWTARTPEEGARDLARVIRRYREVWHRDRVILIGYSFGADVLPFFASRLPPDLAAAVDGVVLLGPSRRASFEFHLSEWLGGASADDPPTLPEVRKLAGMPLLCLYGAAEEGSLCPEIAPPLGSAISFAGAHHFGGDYAAVAKAILARLAPSTRK